MTKSNDIKTILIVEDEIISRNTLKTLLEGEGYEVLLAANGEEMQNKITNNIEINLLILDISLPGKNGLLLARELKNKDKYIPIVFLTGKNEEIDKVLGLEIGADDYITKPYNPRELVIRIRNILTRIEKFSKTNQSDKSSIDKYAFNNWHLNIDSRSLISPKGTNLKLPKSEFKTLLYLLENPGKILSRSQIIKNMTGKELKENDRTVDVTIRRLRKHFESEQDNNEIIMTIHGEGYRFNGTIEEIVNLKN